MTDPSFTELPKDDAAILFADVSGSTALYRALGNERAQALIEKTLGLLGEAAGRQAGRVVKTIGDEVMCRFDSASAAARAAIDMQRRIHAVPPEPGAELRVRIGFAFGKTVERGSDVFGDVV